MRPKERRQRIIHILLQSGAVSVKQLIEVLQVSEVTIRDDLRHLEGEGKLIRTHGGATLGNSPRMPTPIGSFSQQDSGHHQQEIIQRIARRAASLVQSGETILLLNSAIASVLADELLNTRSLTILTNSLHLATTLFRNPLNKVMLIGGELRPDGDTVDGPISVEIIRSLRVHKAFFTCDGLTLEQGYADNDLSTAQLKKSALLSAQTTIVMSPGDQVGTSALMSFAALDQVQHLITTESAPTQILSALREAGVYVTVCDKHLTQIIGESKDKRCWRIGFANLTEKQEFAVLVRQGIEQAARKAKNVELICADNKADPTTALTNARELLQKGIDLLIEYQQDEYTNYVVMDMYRSANIPVIAVDIPIPGAIYFGADNYRAGKIAGDAAVRWIRKNWNGRLDKVICLEQPESGAIPAMRVQGQLDKLQAAFDLRDTDFLRYNTHGDLEGSQAAATHALRTIGPSKCVLFIGINFNSALGSLAAAHALDRRENMAVISQNASGRIRRELIHGNPALIGAVDYLPQDYGANVIPLAVSILEGRSVPPAIYTDHILLTAENIHKVYRSTGSNQDR